MTNQDFRDEEGFCKVLYVNDFKCCIGYSERNKGRFCNHLNIDNLKCTRPEEEEANNG